MPLFLVGLLVASAVLAVEHPWARLVARWRSSLSSCLARGAAARRPCGRLRPGASLAYYFCVGNLGTLLG